ncbi:MAG: serine hydrolase domain-containing protein [Pseudomonadota bacterium]
MSELITKTIDHDFAPLHARLQWYVDEELLSCCASLVLHGQDVVDYQTFGYMDLESRTPLRDDAIYRMYSNTKIVTSVAAMQLVERGQLDLDAPLESYLPEFADMQVLADGATAADQTVAATTPMTPRQLLSHTAGLSYGFIEPESVIDGAYLGAGIDILGVMGPAYDEPLAQLSRRLGELPLVYQPGSQWRYSFATDVTARLIEVVAGQSFDAYLQANVFDPLGMTDTGFHVPTAKQDRFTTMYAGVDPLAPMKPGLVKADDPREGSYARPRQLLSGGGGLVSTIADYLTFVRMIINGGEWQGERLIAAATLTEMRRNQCAPGVQVAFPMWAMPGTTFGLGFALRESLADDDDPRAQDEYHWGGMAGTHSWMSPAGVTGFCLTQRMPGFWHPFSHEFRQHAYASLPG